VARSYGRVNTARPRRVTIQADQSPQSSADGSIPAWSNPVTLCQAWTIDWRTQGGRMEWLADQPRAEHSAVVRIRWRSDVLITPANRMVYTDVRGTVHAYDITAVIDVNNQHQYLDLYVRERAV
jgi:head-tail adaptor